MPDWTKKERQVLNQLVDLAYERELSQALRDLEQEFARWHNGEASPFAVSDAIHQFHDHRARELYNFYVMFRNPALTVTIALRNGVLQANEVPAGLLPGLQDAPP